MKLLNFFISLILLLSISVNLNSQNLKYSRVKIEIEKSEVYELAKLGLPIDDGVKYEKKYLIAEYSENELQILKENDYEYEILIDDLSKFYAERNKNPEKIKKCKNTPDNFHLGSMGGNLTLDEIFTELDEMHDLYPDLISEKQPITTDYTTHNGNYVYWVKISDNPEQNENEYEVLQTSLHHAREPLSMMQLVYLMWYLLENYENEEEAKYLVDNFEIYFVLCENPDGYLYNESTDPNGGGMWRKNRRDNGSSYGVDPNRNYPYKWGFDNTGSSSNPSSETYRGPSAGSEPITQMMMEFVNNHEFLIADNKHTYSDLLLYPWGYDQIHPPHNRLFSNYANIMTIENGYTTGQPWEILYVVNGDSNDWMYSEKGVFAYTSESGNQSQGFWPPQSDIIPMCEGNLEMNLFQIRLAGMYADINDVSNNLVPAHGYLNFDIHFLGLDTLGTFSVYIESDDFVIADDTVYFTNFHKFEHKQDSLYYQLNENFETGDQFTYTLNLNNGMYTYSKEITKTVGKENIIFQDPGNNINNWTTSQWSITDESAHSPTSSITDSEGGNYNNNVSSHITLTNPISVNSAEVNLNFWAKWNIESDWDYTQFLISTNSGNTWEAIETEGTEPGTGSFQPTGEPVYDGNADWCNQTVDLAAYQDEDILCRFQINSDGYVNDDGFYFDDFTISEINTDNDIPVINDNAQLYLFEDTIIITLNHLDVTDNDNIYPDDFVLFIQDGENYSVFENGIVVDDGFSNDLTIPVAVHDGYNLSDYYDIIFNVNNLSKIDNSVNIYPNPAKNKLFISIKNNEDYNKLYISDLNGKTVSEKIINKKIMKLNIDNLKPGVYIITIDGKNSISKKIIIE